MGAASVLFDPNVFRIKYAVPVAPSRGRTSGGPPLRRGYDGQQRRAQSAATRERILDRARGLVVERGYRGPPIAELPPRADVPVHPVYELVGRKPVILRELVE